MTTTSRNVPKRGPGDSTWPLRLLALTIALVVWVVVTLDYRGERSAEKSVEAAVTYPPLEGFVILNPEDRVRVRLRGRERDINAVTPYAVDVRVDIADPSPGLLDVPLGAANVRAPREISVVSVEPAVLRLELDHEIQRLLPIRVRLTGEPAAGARALEPVARPAELLVEGPASLLRSLDEVLVVTVSLEGHALSFRESQVVPSPDRLVKILQSPVVTVDIPMKTPGVEEDGDEP